MRITGGEARGRRLTVPGGLSVRPTSDKVREALFQILTVRMERAWEACRVLGWGIAQVITLIAPETVVIGGGVSLIGEACFFRPLREEVARYVFPPLVESYQLVPAQLGELVVVHGAVALARMEERTKE